MFEVQKLKVGGFEAVRLINAHTQEYLEVLTEFGAGINGYVILNRKGKLCAVIDGYRTDLEIRNEHHFRFKGSKLSPFPNRVIDGKYSFDNKHYQLAINEVRAGNSLHAFLHNKSFEIVSKSSDENAARLILRYKYKGTERGYPFPYELILSYEIKVDGIEIVTKVINCGLEIMPVGDGWHPYFKFPKLNKVEMQMDPVRQVTSSVGNGDTNANEFKQLNEIGKNVWDDCFQISENDCFTLKLKDKVSNVELIWWQDAAEGKYKYLQIYTPPDRKSIALEPVTCAPNAFNTGQGLIELKPNETMSARFGIKNIRQTD